MIGFICITKISLGNMENFIGAIETQSGIKSKKYNSKTSLVNLDILVFMSIKRYFKDNKNYVKDGGFLFAMCSATDSYDIALAMGNLDGVEAVYDGTPTNPDLQNNLDYSQCFAFENFKIISDPMIYEFSDIDFPPSHNQ